MNKNDTRRLEILKDYLVGDYMGGCMRFENAPPTVIKQLFDEDFIVPGDRQNFSPTAHDLYNFMKANITVVASGYIIGPERNDYRATIDSVSGSVACKPDVVCDLLEIARSADEFECDTNGDMLKFYAWWD